MTAPVRPLALRDRCSRIVHKLCRLPGKSKAPITLTVDEHEDITSEAYLRSLVAYRRRALDAGAFGVIVWKCCRSAIIDHQRSVMKIKIDRSADPLTIAMTCQEHYEPCSCDGLDDDCPECRGTGDKACRLPAFWLRLAHEDRLALTALALSKGLGVNDTATLRGIGRSTLNRHIAELREAYSLFAPLVRSIAK